jgi:hypothetical protein
MVLTNREILRLKEGSLVRFSFGNLSQIADAKIRDEMKEDFEKWGLKDREVYRLFNKYKQDGKWVLGIDVRGEIIYFGSYLFDRA